MQFKTMLFVGAALATTSVAIAGEKTAEFGERCAYGVALGKSVECSDLTWTGPNGNLYCFGSKGGQEKFMEDPEGNLDKAFSKYQEVVASEG